MVKSIFKFFTITALYSIFFILSIKCEINENWVHPDAWSLSAFSDNMKISQQCNYDAQSPESMEEKIASTYYKKLIKYLFKRENFVYNEKTNIYHRNIKFIISESQIDKLEQVTNLRDLDSILNEILLNVETFQDFEGSFFIVSIWNGLKTIFSTMFSTILSITELRFELLLIIVILLIIYIRRMHGTSLALIITFGLFFSGYIYKYFECNRKLEIDQLAEYHDLLNMPCSENKQSEEKNVWNLWGLLSSKPSQAQCLEYLRKKNKLRLPFCRPDDVFFKYINEIILNQFQMTVEKSTYIFKEINELMPFPYNIVAGIIFCTLLVTYLQLSFKYILSPHIWLPFISNSSGHETKNTSSHHHDKISGENLKTVLKILERTTSSITKQSTNETKENNRKAENIRIITSGIQILAPLPSTSKDELNEKLTNHENKISNNGKATEISELNKTDEINNQIVTDLKQNIDKNDILTDSQKNLSLKANNITTNIECDKEYEVDEEDDIIIISSEFSIKSNENVTNVNDIKKNS